MWNIYIILSASALVFAQAIRPGPLHPPSHGEVWPEPQCMKKEISYYSFNPSDLVITATHKKCDILHRAIDRYDLIFRSYGERLKKFRTLAINNPYDTNGGIMKDLNDLHSESEYMGAIERLEIHLSLPCETYPHLGMNENYNLTIGTVSELTSSSVWGILRGLETFAQLIYIEIIDGYFMELRINKTEIHDYPHYSHRGLLIDTSRHYISTSTILTMLDAMAINKMNVLHWHIVDDPSFPYRSDRFPSLSSKGAYHFSLIYDKNDIQEIIDYARDRGIRVIPEFDVPGHTRSWGAAFPYLLTECYKNGRKSGLGPMHPLRNTTYKFLNELVVEVKKLFPDIFFHIGGDEVDFVCWDSNPEIKKYMEEHKINDPTYFHSYFMKKTMTFIEDKLIPVVWEEPALDGVPLPKHTLVQIWKDGYIDNMMTVLKAGYRVVFSAAWYLDKIDMRFQDYYVIDPRHLINIRTDNKTLAEGIIGGEACMWGEMVDDSNIFPRVWPRACAVAERLWSGVDETYARELMRNTAFVPEYVWNRIEEHTCRMLRRGIPTQPPSGPGFCLV